ncbi:putative MFS drug efflux pump [Drepanopeziza brunnea f. sp. 'multigermtubi' MB_m1]|uniref:Putative MFS drug efflux pump n=1 Tax=Marssonina brunnea f. sp. multigermtubi (strain MB_m1) TaxID=1072389 RepID=K1WWN5_MARBU|nr:putative MFS drug efflux pump [Drepanopeziza brunnea f. sp. 'multigermtubi' MB_m1]EKD16937.1 putative MFS drug efflux pump [Drepanopeziza brunnea f. sp. 'multigermtubi' MB_m1]
MGQSQRVAERTGVSYVLSPDEFLANALGLAFSARAIGRTFGSATVNESINNKLASTLAIKVSEAAIEVGLPTLSFPPLFQAMATRDPTAFAAVVGLHPQILGAAIDASQPEGFVAA